MRGELSHRIPGIPPGLIHWRKADRGTRVNIRMTLAVMLVLLCGTVFAKPRGLPDGAVQVQHDNVAWSDGPRSLPPGVKIAVLEGNPRNRGIFTMRLKVPDGTTIPPHWHPRAERVTVLEGKVGVGFGRRFDKERLRYFRKGDFYLNPPKAHHYIHFARDSVVQVTGEGPWEVHYLERGAD
jgi:hypothetical protein